MKDDFEATVVCAIYKVFPDSDITGCNSHFSRCLWRQLQNIGLTVEYKEKEKSTSHPECVLLWHTYLSVKQKWFGL